MFSHFNFFVDMPNQDNNLFYNLKIDELFWLMFQGFAKTSNDKQINHIYRAFKRYLNCFELYRKAKKDFKAAHISIYISLLERFR
jgi:hypothetical protein